MIQIVYALVEFDTQERMTILDIFRKEEDAKAEMKRVWREGLWDESSSDKTLIMVREFPLR
jgi:hypothetical protein